MTQQEVETAPLFGPVSTLPDDQEKEAQQEQQQSPDLTGATITSDQQPPPAVVTTIPVATTPSPATSTTTTAKVLPEDVYDLQRCTVCIGLQFYPVSQEGAPRRVLLSIQNGAGNREDLPLLAVLTSDELGGPLPQAIQELWARLEADLPQRRKRQEERTAQAAVKAAAVVTSSSSSRKSYASKTLNASTNSTTPPLPPTTSTPIAKEGLTMGGLFEVEQ